MHAWTLELTGLPEWLVEEWYSTRATLLKPSHCCSKDASQPFDPGSGTRDAASEGGGRLLFDAIEPIDTRVEDVSAGRMD